MTTIENITDAQIETLRGEAANAGDAQTYDACYRALEGDTEALALCAEIISDAEAMEN